MKTNKKELARFKALIENDRLNTGDEFYNLVTNDIKKLLSDYFELSSMPQMEIVKTGDNLIVKMVVTATRLKVFASLPSE
jgi:uncharacterized protein YaiL (DUF2058 family)